MADNAAIMEQAYEAFGRGDIETVLAAFDEQIEWWSAENSTYWQGRPLVGPEAVAQGIFQRIAADTTDFRVNVHRIVGCGDTVLAQGRYTGTWNATGRPLDAQFAHVWNFQGERVVRFQQYTDTYGWAQTTS